METELERITNKKVVGTQIMTTLKEKWPDTKFSFNHEKSEIAAWDEGKGKWMAICGISNLGQWTDARSLLQYVEGDATAPQKNYPQAKEVE